MRVVSRRMVFGDDAVATGAPTDDSQVNLQIRPTTAAAGLGLWVLAGVLTHISIRIIDRWFFR